MDAYRYPINKRAKKHDNRKYMVHPENVVFLDYFTKLKRKALAQGHSNLIISYCKIISSILKYPLPIRTSLDAFKLKGVGKGFSHCFEKALIQAKEENNFNDVTNGNASYNGGPLRIVSYVNAVTNNVNTFLKTFDNDIYNIRQIGELSDDSVVKNLKEIENDYSDSSDYILNNKKTSKKKSKKDNEKSKKDNEKSKKDKEKSKKDNEKSKKDNEKTKKGNKIICDQNSNDEFNENNDNFSIMKSPSIQESNNVLSEKKNLSTYENNNSLSITKNSYTYENSENLNNYTIKASHEINMSELFLECEGKSTKKKKPFPSMSEKKRRKNTTTTAVVSNDSGKTSSINKNKNIDLNDFDKNTLNLLNTYGQLYTDCAMSTEEIAIAFAKYYGKAEKVNFIKLRRLIRLELIEKLENIENSSFPMSSRLENKLSSPVISNSNNTDDVITSETYDKDNRFFNSSNMLKKINKKLNIVVKVKITSKGKDFLNMEKEKMEKEIKTGNSDIGIVNDGSKADNKINSENESFKSMEYTSTKINESKELKKEIIYNDEEKYGDKKCDEKDYSLSYSSYSDYYISFETSCNKELNDFSNKKRSVLEMKKYNTKYNYMISSGIDSCSPNITNICDGDNDIKRYNEDSYITVDNDKNGNNGNLNLSLKMDIKKNEILENLKLDFKERLEKKKKKIMNNTLNNGCTENMLSNHISQNKNITNDEQLNNNRTGQNLSVYTLQCNKFKNDEKCDEQCYEQLDEKDRCYLVYEYTPNHVNKNKVEDNTNKKTYSNNYNTEHTCDGYNNETNKDENVGDDIHNDKNYSTVYNSSSITGNSSSITGNSSSITGNSSSITGNSSSITGNSSSITGNSSSITGNSSSITDSNEEKQILKNTDNEGVYIDCKKYKNHYNFDINLDLSPLINNSKFNHTCNNNYTNLNLKMHKEKKNEPDIINIFSDSSCNNSNKINEEHYNNKKKEQIDIRQNEQKGNLYKTNETYAKSIYFDLMLQNDNVENERDDHMCVTKKTKKRNTENMGENMGEKMGEENMVNNSKKKRKKNENSKNKKVIDIDIENETSKHTMNIQTNEQRNEQTNGGKMENDKIKYGPYEIVMIIDNRDVSNASYENNEKMKSIFRNNNVKYETRNLPLGDIIWLCRRAVYNPTIIKKKNKKKKENRDDIYCSKNNEHISLTRDYKNMLNCNINNYVTVDSVRNDDSNFSDSYNYSGDYNCSNKNTYHKDTCSNNSTTKNVHISPNKNINETVEYEEYVLKWIIERKTLNDLSASIVDGRYDEQKYRLMKSRKMHHIIYLIENSNNSFKNYMNTTKIPYETLSNAQFSTQLVNGFSILSSQSMKHTFFLLTEMHLQIVKIIKNICNIQENEEITYSNELFSYLQTNSSIWEYWNNESKKSKNNVVKEIFGKQLRLIHMCGPDAIEFILSLWPTPIKLNEALNKYTHDGILAEKIKKIYLKKYDNFEKKRIKSPIDAHLIAKLRQLYAPDSIQVF
ncbi:crossover junction endonuclease MUS81, putative [Hepatocystis sp. ex Piliocolobus tephrosceles]|nr:crossover junction endonuclease MUS81, putative [Hepatocystis sp. ex Piliocolobus tephrosceles]